MDVLLDVLGVLGGLETALCRERQASVMVLSLLLLYGSGDDANQAVGDSYV